MTWDVLSRDVLSGSQMHYASSGRSLTCPLDVHRWYRIIHKVLFEQRFLNDGCCLSGFSLITKCPETGMYKTHKLVKRTQ